MKKISLVVFPALTIVLEALPDVYKRQGLCILWSFNTFSSYYGHFFEEFTSGRVKNKDIKSDVFIRIVIELFLQKYRIFSIYIRKNPWYTYLSLIHILNLHQGINQRRYLCQPMEMNSQQHMSIVTVSYTHLLASIGTERSAKRATIIHLSFNIIGTAIFTIL